MDNFEVTVINKLGLPEQEVLVELLLAETRMNDTNRLRFHVKSQADTWNVVGIDVQPEFGVEVDGWSKEWVHPDFNPKGIKTCYLTDDDYWMVASWCNNCDAWHTRPSGEEQWDKDAYDQAMPAPTHWKSKPQPPEETIIINPELN